MSMKVAPIGAAMNTVAAAAPKSKAAKAIALGESIMSPKDEKSAKAKNIIFAIIENLAKKSKAKPDAERNIVDYILIVADKLKDINPAKYAA